MNILVIGAGGREHALVWKLRENKSIGTIWCAPGNSGIGEIARCIPIKATDVEGIVAFARENKPDLCVVTPDDPLVLGMVDALERVGFKAFGPRKNAAIIEGSKSFAKQFMRKYDIPTAKYRVFTDLREAKAYIESEGAPIVIKADGLALGKGVVVAQTVNEALEAAQSMLEGGKFGESGKRIVVEECMSGPEVSVLCFTDGKTVSPMVSSQDHKRVYENDLGPNTGGMGAFAPSPKYTKDIAARCMEEIITPTVRGMAAEGRTFKGVLYFGLMLTADGPKVVEYNARFGDPETQAVLPLLDSDLLEIFLAVVEERLDTLDIRWKDASSACIALTSGGYPGSYTTGYPITGIEEAKAAGGMVFHAGTRLENGVFVTGGGRVLGVCALGDSLESAVRAAYAAADKITFKDIHMRRDIGKK